MSPFVISPSFVISPAAIIPYRPPSFYQMRSLFTNNADVYYKPHSLASGVTGTTKNSRHKSKKT